MKPVFDADSSTSYAFNTDEFSEIRWFPITDLPLDQSDPHIGRFCEKVKIQDLTKITK